MNTQQLIQFQERCLTEEFTATLFKKYPNFHPMGELPDNPDTPSDVIPLWNFQVEAHIEHIPEVYWVRGICRLFQKGFKAPVEINSMRFIGHGCTGWDYGSLSMEDMLDGQLRLGLLSLMTTRFGNKILNIWET